MQRKVDQIIKQECPVLKFLNIKGKTKEIIMYPSQSQSTSPVFNGFNTGKSLKRIESSGKTAALNRENITSSFIIMVLLILIIMHFSSWNLFGQSLAGTWTESRYNVKMVLSENGTYQIQYPKGYSQGLFSINGQTFCMRDASGANPVCYTVVSYSGNDLVMRDVNGVILNYKRQGSVVSGTGQGAGGGEILAQKAGYTLNNSHFNAGIGILQFIIGQTVKPSELRELKQKLIEEFQQAPAEVIRQLNSLGNSLQTIRSATDPVRIGLARQELFAALYKATMNFKEEDKPLMIQVMNRYIKVLAYDPNNNLLLTDKDAGGMLNYLAFNSELMGQKIQFNGALRRSTINDLVSRFASMPLEQKRLLCSASLIWELVEYNWNRLTSAQKLQYKNAYSTQIGQNTQSYQSFQQQNYNSGNNYQSNSGSSGSNKSAADMRREHRAKQHMFRMMNEMNMNTHATSLNIIENIGGTGNYWSVVDY